MEFSLFRKGKKPDKQPDKRPLPGEITLLPKGLSDEEARKEIQRRHLAGFRDPTPEEMRSAMATTGEHRLPDQASEDSEILKRIDEALAENKKTAPAPKPKPIIPKIERRERQTSETDLDIPANRIRRRQEMFTKIIEEARADLDKLLAKYPMAEATDEEKKKWLQGLIKQKLIAAKISIIHT